MHIKVKGVSGHLVFVLDDSQEVNNLIKELEGLLDSPLFKSNGFYPKAFFDFQCRILKEDEILAFFKVLVECQSLLFGGFVEKKTQKEQEIRMIEGSIHGGEVIEINEDTLITGKINPGAIIQLNAKLYVMQGVYGIIESNNSQASISSQVFKDATLRFFKKTIHHFTTFEMSLVYYKDDAIVIEKGDYIHV